MSKPERQLDKPEQDNAPNGAKIAFTEKLDTNLTVLQQYLDTPRFKVTTLTVGTIAPTKVAVCYVEGLVDKEIYNDVIERISAIEIKYVPNKKAVTDHLQSRWTGDMFPTLRTTERFDSFVSTLMEGRVGIIVDNNPFGIIVPSLFWECFYGSNDYFAGLGKYNLPLFRFLCFLFAILTPAVLLALYHFHPQVLKQAPKIFTMKETGLPPLAQILILLLIFKMLVDIVYRLHRPFVVFISFVSANIVGQTAISANLFTPFIVVAISLSVIAGLQVYNRLSSLEQLRFPLLFVGYLFGFTGLIFAYTAIFIYAAVLHSFRVPYLSPLLPLRTSELRDSLFLRGNLDAIINRTHKYKKIKKTD